MDVDFCSVITNTGKTCLVCHTPLPEKSESCPVCALRSALNAKYPAGELAANPTPALSSLEFEHYEVLVLEDGTPMELGRGAMGVTFKATDVNLEREVALKVINTSLIGDEAANRRFVREARAAARVRHPNVASVFHLGRTGDSYFYAMEFVEGESLDKVIQRDGRLQPPAALRVTALVAAGLEAIYEQDLIHRDIKPANIMVRWHEDKVTGAKIIDLGLAKGTVADERGSISTLSAEGAFTGTPRYASPEQFAGIGADIRSDLYSLGVTLWEMVTGEVPYLGSASELNYQHQRAPLPLGKLGGVPQPIIGLLEVLLRKDPTRRFQNPTELLQAIPRVTEAVNSHCDLTADQLRPSDDDLDASVKQSLEQIQPVSPRSRNGVPRWSVALCVGIMGLLLVWFLVSGQGAKFFRPSEAGANQIEKSIAVLPFENISANKDDAYFADGVQDEILNDLAKIAQLKVISRTSVMQYRAGNKRDLRQIASALNVGHVLEGTIRRDGNRVRISTELIDASNDKTVWADSFDRDLTDIFTIQSEIAQTVADRLKARLSPAEERIIKERPTEDLVAYDLYLQAKAKNTFWAVGNQREDMFKQVDLLTEATRRDPEFVLAYCLLGHANDYLYALFYDHTSERREKAEAAVNQAMRLRPDMAESRLALAHYLMVVEHNYERARTQIEIAQQLAPKNTRALELLAQLDWKEGNWEDAPKYLQRAIELDPRNLDLLSQLEKTYSEMRRYQDSQRIWPRILELAPGNQNLRLIRCMSLFGEKGDLNLLQEALVLKYSAENSDAAGIRFQLAVCARDWAAAEQTLQAFQRDEFPVNENLSYFVPRSFCEGLIAHFQGNEEKAKTAFSLARTRLQGQISEHPDDFWALSYLGLSEAFLGERGEAIEHGKQAIQILPAPRNAFDLRLNLAAIYAQVGDSDSAVAELAGMIGKPVGPRYGELKLHPLWDPLRGQPGFQKILDELQRS